MDYEDELAQMQEEALAELDGGDNDTNEDENQSEESTGDADYKGQDADDGEDTQGDERENDFEDDEELNDEDDSDNDDDEADSENSDYQEDSSGFTPVEVQVGNQTITLDSQEELLAFVKKGSSQPSRSRKSKNDQIVEQGNLSEDDLKLFIDARNGDADAIAKIAKQAKVDVYELSEEQADNYRAKFEPQLMTEVDEVAEDILNDVPLHTQFQEVVKTIPDDFKAEIATNPKALRNFANHIKSGLAQEVIPQAIKAQILEGGSFLENYAKIGRELSKQNTKEHKEKTVRKVNPRAEKLKEKAKNHKGSNKGTRTKQTGDDIWDMSSEDFAKEYMGQ